MNVSQTPDAVLVFAVIGLWLVIWGVMATASYLSVRLAIHLTRSRKKETS